MATSKTSNTLSLKVNLVFDQAEAIRQTKKTQETIDKEREKGLKNQTDAAKKQNKTQATNNKNLKEQAGLIGTIKTEFGKMFKNYVKFFLMSQVFLALQTQMRRAVELAIQLDTAFTNFKIVSKATASEVAFVDIEVGKLTSSLGALKADVINVVTEFSRAGFTIKESLGLAETAIIGANVGMTELESVTTFLIAGLKAFKMEAEDSTRILDVLFRVANTTAINLEGIGEAFLRSANTLNTAGASLEQSAALIAAANESIQDPAKVGTALKTIASRLRGVGDEGESIPTLAKDFDNVGIAIQNADGSFRDIYSVFQDFANIYDTLDDLTRESLLEKLAGKRQKNIMIGLLENFDTAEQALKDANNSAGEAALAQEKFLESLAGRLKQAKEAWNGVLDALTSTGALKNIISLFTGFAKVLQFVITKIPILITVTSLFVAKLAVANIAITVFGVTVGGATVAVGSLATATALATAGLSILIGGLALLAQGAVLSGKNVEKVVKTVGELSTEIEDLESKIKNLNKTENKTDAQEKRLKLLEETLEATRNLRAETELANAEARDDKISPYFSKIPKGTEEDLSDYRLELKKLQLEAMEANLTIDENTAAFKRNAKQIPLIDALLVHLDNQYADRLGTTIPDVTGKIEGSTSAMSKQAIALKEVMDLTDTASDDYQMLSNALSELEDNGYLTIDTLNALQDVFPQIAIQTGLTKEAFEEFTKKHGEFTKEQIQNGIDLLESEITLYKSRIGLLRGLAEVQDELGLNAGIDLESSIRGFEAKVINAKNATVELRNQLALIGSFGKDKPKDDPSTDKKEISLLTEKEVLYRKLTQQIEMYQKELQRTDDTSQQIVLNDKLIDLYGQQKQALLDQQKALLEQNKGLKRTDEAYEDFLDNSEKLALSIEDTTNSIYGLTKANKELSRSMTLEGLIASGESIEQMKDDVDKLRELIGKLVEKELTDQIDKNQELIDSAKEQLDIKLKQLEVEQDLYNFTKSREAKEKDISKLSNRIASLKTASDQGDSKAKALLLQLEQEKADLQETLDDEINQRGFELRKENLQNQYDEFESTKNDENKLLQSNLEDAEYMSKATNDRMAEYLKGSTSDLYKNLIGWNKEYGTNFDNDVISRWEKLISLMKEASLSGGNINGSLDSFGTGTNLNEDAIVNKMKQNSLSWFNASEVERKRLAEENQMLGSQIGASYNNGSWFRNGAALYDNGGKFERGNIALKNSNDSEWILKDKQLSKIIGMGLTSVLASGSLNQTQQSQVPDVNITIEGSVSDDNVGRISRDIKNIINDVSKGQVEAFKSQGIKSNTRIR